MLHYLKWLCPPFAIGLVFLAACGDPCKELSKTICNCEPDMDKRIQCQRQSEMREKKAYANGVDRRQALERCSRYVGRCNCQALAEQKLSECGLSDPAIVQP